jgi:3-methyladenine DNA glycosylase AlkD
MTVDEIMQQLQQMGSEQTKKVFLRHGAREPFFGVKVEDLKKIQKKVKSDYQLSLQLFNTGNSDAM